jgi:hypothetical protein
MGKMNVAQFAGELGLPVELLLEQLKSAGVSKQKDSDSISEQDKSQLLEHLRSAHGGASKGKITRRWWKLLPQRHLLSKRPSRPRPRRWWMSRN